MKTSQETKNIFFALSKAQGAMEGAKKDTLNPFFKSKYANLQSVYDAIRVPFSSNGLAVVQEPRSEADRTEILAMITHSSGEWIQFDGLFVPHKEHNNPQSLKSGITLIRRAQLLSICGLAEDDDDGNEASVKKDDKPYVKPTEKQYSKPINHAPQDPEIGLNHSIEFIKKATLSGIWTREHVVSYIRTVYKKDIANITVKEAKEFLELAGKRTFEELTQVD